MDYVTGAAKCWPVRCCPVSHLCSVIYLPISGQQFMHARYLSLLTSCSRLLHRTLLSLKYRNFKFSAGFLESDGKCFLSFYQSPVQVILNFNSIVVPTMEEIIFNPPVHFSSTLPQSIHSIFTIVFTVITSLPVVTNIHFYNIVMMHYSNGNFFCNWIFYCSLIASLIRYDAAIWNLKLLQARLFTCWKYTSVLKQIPVNIISIND